MGGIHIGEFRTRAYLLDAITGGLLNTLRNPDPLPGQRFGTSVALSGNDLIIGAPDGTKADQFEVNIGRLLRTLRSPSNDFGISFGFSVVIDDNAILVGAPCVGGVRQVGAAHLFDSRTGNLLKTFLNPNSEGEDDRFSYSIAIDGNNILIGAPYTDMQAEMAGAADLFDKSSGDLLRTLSNPTPDPLDEFGITTCCEETQKA